MAADFNLDRTVLLDAFRDLGTRAHAEGRVVEIAVYGGSALMLTYDWRAATRDVDAVFEADKATVRRLSAQVALERGWPADWLNDGVKGFLSAGDAEPSSKVLFGTFPSEDQPGLRVMLATPEYLFAMKSRAMRLGGVEENADVGDIRRLADEIGLTSADAALDLVARFYPHRMLEPKTRFGLEEIFAALADRATHPRPDGPDRSGGTS